jgi:SAM-dependent methyltransferase
MTTPFTYDFGYAWFVAWAPAVPLALFGALSALAAWRGWRRWIVAVSGLLALWSVAALVFIHLVVRINLPMEISSPHFLASGGGDVVDVGAGSGRAGIGLLLARPNVRLTAVDLYDGGFWGITGNTPERFMRNARIAGVADRARAQAGDARRLPLPDAAYDGAISSYAIDHLRRSDVPAALSEVARVLKPGGEFLLAIVNAEWWVVFVSPPIGHHPRPNPQRWREMLGSAGFDVLEQWTTAASLNFRSRKP